MKKETLMEFINSPKNLIVHGDLASGKTKNILFLYVEKLLSKKESLFIVDSKEEYLKYFADRVKEDYNVIVINLRNPNLSEGFNPLEYPYKVYQGGNIDFATELLENICNIIFYDDSVDPFWNYSATNYVMGIILKLFADKDNSKINLKSIIDEVDTIESLNLENQKKYFKNGDNDNLAYRYAYPIICAPKETSGGIISIVRQKLSIYTNKVNLNKLLETSTFSYNKINHNPSIIFFITRDEDIRNNGLANMLISELFSYLIKDNKRKFNFLIDNFDDLPIIDNLKVLLSSGPSRNIKFILSTRNIEILKNKYSTYLDKLSNIISVDEKINFQVNEEINTQEENQTVEIEESDDEYIEIDLNNYDFDLETKKIENKLEDFEKEEGIKKDINLEYIESELEQFKI